NSGDDVRREALREAGRRLVATRPTAVNLPWAVTRMLGVADATPTGEWTERLSREAAAIVVEDLSFCRAIGRHGLEALPPGRLTVLTHCNAGALATAGYGTALGVIRALAGEGRLARVYADDTRPRQQGARLTAWELHREGLPVTLIADTVAGMLMQRRAIDAVVTGADRVAANGDSANKIGTYQLAVLAAHHGVPFFIAAPTSTIDMACGTGDDIVIEERDPDEVRRIDDVLVAPADVDVFNPAFDVTPGSLITAIITERGVVRPSYRESLASMMQK
ncbi:S-methyl-5-thioribose-1-phosphate isomerase, partial [Myxococcota bacterium]|nr:S-methyl-5-thioribose-1-phosphate isomerase [Myxococcota bacterium]MBU1510842.1 S-methyl-5-thioribose-1-phosphate isomerase [Myxococcota bacterium]